MRALLLLVLGLVASACGPPMMHPGPGYTEKQFYEDSFLCQQAVLSWVFDRELYIACMKGHGHVD